MNIFALPFIIAAVCIEHAVVMLEISIEIVFVLIEGVLECVESLLP